MLNREIISDTIPSLHPTDTIARAQDLMTDFRVAHLAVVDEDRLLGIVSEDSLLNAPDEELAVGSLQHEFSKLSVRGGNHFIESLQFAADFNLTVIPVVDKETEYLGSILATDLLKQTAIMIGVGNPGAVIVLEMEKISYSFSEISKLVETNDAQITQLNSYWDPVAAAFYVTLKINRLEISDIIATFQRYEYKVKYYFGEELYENELRSNYDHLMNYLSI